MNSILEVIPTEKLGFPEALGFGLEMLGIGMLAIFAVLGIIWVTLSIFKYVFNKNTASENPVKPKPAETAPAPVYVSQNDEIVAVIAAAIAMAESECNDGTKFRVVSFRRK